MPAVALTFWRGGAASYGRMPSRSVGLRREDRLDGELEHCCQLEGERQAQVVAARLDGVDGLAGYIEAVGEVGLPPAPDSAQFPKPIVHRVRRDLMVSVPA